MCQLYKKNYDVMIYTNSVIRVNGVLEITNPIMDANYIIDDEVARIPHTTYRFIDI